MTISSGCFVDAKKKRAGGSTLVLTCVYDRYMFPEQAVPRGTQVTIKRVGGHTNTDLLVNHIRIPWTLTLRIRVEPHTKKCQLRGVLGPFPHALPRYFTVFSWLCP